MDALSVLVQVGVVVTPLVVMAYFFGKFFDAFRGSIFNTHYAHEKPKRTSLGIFLSVVYAVGAVASLAYAVEMIFRFRAYVG